MQNFARGVIGHLFYSSLKSDISFPPFPLFSPIIRQRKKYWYNLILLYFFFIIYFCCIFKCLTYPYTHPTLGLLYLQFPLPRMFFLQLSTGFPPSLHSEFAQMPHYQGHCLGYSKWNCIHPPPSLFLSSCCATHLMVCFFVQQNIISLYGLDVLCPSRIHMLKPTAQCDGVRRWGPLGGG